MTRTAVRLCVVLLILISLAPVLRTVAEAFIDVQTVDGVRTTTFTLAHVASIPTATGSGGGALLTALGNSTLIALLSALFALVIGVPYALLIARTDVPARGLFATLFAAPLVLPPLLVAVSWTLLFGAPGSLVHSDDSFGQGAIAILRAASLFALGTFPLVVLFVTRALRTIPASMEESARIVGGGWRALRHVTLPLVMPSALAASAFVFLFALHDFSLVDFLNWVRPLPQQIRVYPFESFGAWQRSDGVHTATAAGLPLGLIGAGVLIFVLQLTARTAVTTVAGDFREPKRIELGGLRWPAFAFGATVLAFAVGIPVLGLMLKAGGLANYRAAMRIVAGPESGTHEIAWTFWLAGGAAVLSVVPAFILAHHAARTRRIRHVVLAFLPLALPPIFLGIGVLKLYASDVFAIPLPGGGTRNPFTDVDGPRLGAMLLLMAKYLPFAVAALWAAILSIDPKLEEAAATAGAGPLERSLAITAPLAAPAIALAAVLVLVFSFREIDTVVLLSSDTLMRRIYSMVHFSRDEQVAALAVILMALEALPFILLGLLMPRRDRKDRRGGRPATPAAPAGAAA